MKLYELTMALCERLESKDPKLVQLARASWNPTQGSLEGGLAEQILDHIKNMLSSCDNKLKRDAYNEIAQAEGLGQIDEGEVDFDLWIHEALLDPVIGMLMNVEDDSQSPSRRCIH